MHVWTGFQWEKLQGTILSGEHAVGTVKLFSYMEHAADQDVDFEILKQPRFWQYTPTENAWTHSSEGDTTVPTYTWNDVASNSFDLATNAGNVVSNSLHSSQSSTSLRATG